MVREKRTRRGESSRQAEERHREEEERARLEEEAEMEGEDISYITPEGFQLTSLAHIERYQNYEGKKKETIVPSRYTSPGALSQLGLLEDVNWMFHRVGWTTFMNTRSPTIRSLTLEFLSTLEIVGPDNDIRSCTFQLCGRTYTRRIPQFCELFGLLQNQCPHQLEEFDASEFWAAISDEPWFNPQNAKASAIHHPVFRYIHRVMCHTIYGRCASTSKVSTQELYFLWCMVHHKSICTATFMLAHLRHVSTTASGGIGIGGLVTTIARGVGIDISDMPVVVGSMSIDMPTLISMKLVQQSNNLTYLLIGGAAVFTLPAPDITIRDQRNWKLRGRPEGAPQGGHEQEQQHGSRDEMQYLQGPGEGSSSQFHHGSSSSHGMYDDSYIRGRVDEMYTRQLAMERRQQEHGELLAQIQSGQATLKTDMQKMFDDFATTFMSRFPPRSPPHAG